MSEYGELHDLIIAAQARANAALADADATAAQVRQCFDMPQPGDHPRNAAIFCARLAVRLAELLQERTSEAAAAAAEAARDEGAAGNGTDRAAATLRAQVQRRRDTVRQMLADLAAFHDREVRPAIDTAAAMLERSQTPTQPEAPRVHQLLSDYTAARAVPETLAARASLILAAAQVDQSLDRALSVLALERGAMPDKLTLYFGDLAAAALDMIRALYDLDIAERIAENTNP